MYAKPSFERRWLLLFFFFSSSNSHVPPQHDEVCCFQKLNCQPNVSYKICVCHVCVFWSLGWFISWIKFLGIDKYMGSCSCWVGLGICTTTWIKANQVESSWAAGASKSSAASEILVLIRILMIPGGANGTVNVGVAMNPGTFKLPTFLWYVAMRFLYFGQLCKWMYIFPCMNGDRQGTQYNSQVFVMGLCGQERLLSIWNMEDGWKSSIDGCVSSAQHCLPMCLTTSYACS